MNYLRLSKACLNYRRYDMNEELIKFYKDRKSNIQAMIRDKDLKNKALDWMLHAEKYNFTYNFSWMGRPIIKYPNDILVQQELMFQLKPDLIIETGIAHGGSIIFSSSMMDMMGIDGEVVGIDIDIRDHNRNLIEGHKFSDKITMYEGDSTDSSILDKVKKHTVHKKCVMVILDSLHTHGHVLRELELYSPLVTQGSYIILPDTFIEFYPKGFFNRPWDVGNNPHTALKSFLEKSDNFEIDKEYSGKASISETIDGYLKKIK